MKNKKIRKRVQFDFSEKTLRRLENLQNSIDAPTKAEVVRRSLRFYEYIYGMLEDGYNLRFEKDDEKIILPLEII